ncbi:hypothetical protein GCM10020331_076420 [Ectobacillus funiculus]
MLIRSKELLHAKLQRFRLAAHLRFFFQRNKKAIPFTYTIPANLPVSRGTVSYYFDTHLDIDGGVDRTDLDRLIVEAPKDVQAVFQALQQLGFHEKAKFW